MWKSIKPRLLSLLRSAVIRLLGWTPVQYALTYVLPKMRMTNRYALANGKDYQTLWLRMQPGDIIFSLDRAKLTSLLIPGHWEHVAMVVENREIIEAVPIHGVRLTSLYDFLRTADEVMLMRPWELPLDDRYADPLWRARRLIGYKYDTKFDAGPEALYCAELVAKCYEEFLNFDWSDFWGIGMRYISPDGIAECAGLKLIYRGGGRE